ncbi:DUF2062 domain-containing protein [Candidatus Woesearchaeota archaeon]|nr:DUF2062 domain-containing protein [Candidatus Woesearchaeota archaeon]
MKATVKNLKDRLKEHFHEMLRLKTTPHEIALGFAVGSFIAIMPTPGFNILLALAVIAIYNKISKVAIFGSFIIWNPLVLIPLYTGAFAIGNMIFTGEPTLIFSFEWLNAIYAFSRRFLIGITIEAFLISVAGYFIVKAIAQRWNKNPSKNN